MGNEPENDVRWPERILRWLFGSPFTRGGAPAAVFLRWLQRILLAALYIFFLWFLYESFWVWRIFD